MRKKMVGSIIVGIVFVGIIVLFYSNFNSGVEYYFNVSVYEISNGYVYGIYSNTSVELYESYFDVLNYTMDVDSSDGYVYNGSEVVLLDKNKKKVSSFVNIVKGDVVSDGIVDDKDISQFREYLSNKYELEEYQVKGMDIDDDGDVDEEDLRLLEEAIDGGVSDISVDRSEIVLYVGESDRVLMKVTPSYGVDGNLKWSSSDNSVFSVNDSGVVVGNGLGNAKLVVEERRGKIKKEVSVRVDNTIRLESNKSYAYVGEKVVIPVLVKNDDGLGCVSNDEMVASCRIDNGNLYIMVNDSGNSEIVVNSPSYGSVSYSLVSYDSLMDFIPDYYCMGINSREIINLDYKYDGMEMVNNSFVENIYMEENHLFLESGSKGGRDEIIFRDNNLNEKKMVVDIYDFDVSLMGSVIKVSEKKEIDIKGDNIGNVSCEVDNNNVAGCYIENNKLYVVGKSKGSTEVKIFNSFKYKDKDYDCGVDKFMVVVV